jgi:alpha-beta hydrolase superfamily lysophospholipase
VYVVELRGHGRSARPAGGFRWTCDDYLQRDLPALLRAVCADARADAVHLVGHSMGGILALSYAATVRASLSAGLVRSAECCCRRRTRGCGR